ncbi:MAG TPA: type II toxin-antitoxin system Phd/YefM family antitoxin [Thermoanaerobaculia bacterium]|jgi:prevent-host-death family protein|nr:type II toxin-antitoxin system Phd/YefM family antitoxin [Thermoanaerobaculia bacterium]
MVKKYSIAEARDNFPSLVHEAETGTTVELTRRGKPVAVLVAQREYDRLTRSRPDFWEAYQDFLRRNPDPEDAMEPEEWLAGVRDPSPGREFSW